MILPNGIHETTREDYDRLEDRANWSTLKFLGRSPLHYRHNILAPKDSDTAAKKTGRASHLAVLEPEKFRSQCALWTGKVRRGKKWDAFQLKHAGADILTEKEYAECVALGEAARSSAMAAPYLAGGKGEQTVLWSHIVPPQLGLDGYRIDMKCRIDFVATIGALVDLKFTRDASPDGFGRECAKYESHVQAALYRDGFKAATGRELPYLLVAVEKTKPHAVQVYNLNEEILALGRERYRALLDRLQMCRREAHWPPYSDGVMDLTLPRWAVPQDEEDVTGLDLVINE